MASLKKIKTCLWFDDQALPAAEFYCGLIPDSHVDAVALYPEGSPMAQPGSVMTVDFTLAGVPYEGINGGTHFKLSPAVSISVLTEDQAETDRLWNALTADGGSESQCGWLVDRFGLSWQIVPQRFVELLDGPDPSKVWQALMNMKKIDIAELEAASGSN